MTETNATTLNSINEVLLQIALALNFINHTQYLFIRNSIKKKPKSAISLLVENHYITDEQKALIIKNYLEEHQFFKQDIRFGALAHKIFGLGLEEIKNALSYQKQIKKFMPLRLGEILVLYKKLTPKQVMEIIEYQESRIIRCSCGTIYNLFKFIKGKTINCYNCGEKIVVPA